MLAVNLVASGALSLALTGQTAPANCGAPEPGQRAGHVLAYDRNNRQVVMFGGVDSANDTPQTLWGWDGVRWTCLSSSGPQGRQDAAMAYDASRGRLVLFGGRTIRNRTATVLRDTWEWNGKNWTMIDSAGPAERVHMSLGYDPVRKSVLLVGGGRSAEAEADTWQWTGTQWKQLSLAAPDKGIQTNLVSTPSSSLKLVLAVPDSASERTGMFRLELAELTGDGWKRESAANTPMYSPKESSVMAGKRVFFYGGWPPDGEPASWVLDGGKWKTVSGSPTRRRGTAIGYDERRNRVVLIGGYDGKNGLSDIWEWDGNAWHRVLPRKVRSKKPQ